MDKIKNKTSGALGKHWELSKKTRKKMSDAQKGKPHPWITSDSFTPEIREKISKALKKAYQERRIVSFMKGKFGKKHPYWKGGRWQTNEGYIYIYSPNHPHAIKSGKTKYMLEHRLVMEKHLRRYLKPFEIIHHKNGIKNDNRIKNLLLIISRGGIHKGKVKCPKCSYEFAIT